MRASQFLIATQKETPADAEIISHQLMLRAGMIRKLASGLYTWLPLGLRVLRQVETIIREEMNAAGAQEVLMPAIQPAELWEETGRWQKYGAELLRVKDRHDRDFCVGPTHEEVITDMARNELRSYKSLPANFYQIQTKFRDERRPRFGVMRAREFIMKDAYSFHVDRDSLDETYEQMYATYSRIFERLGLDFRAVQADGGSIGGSSSHEFHVLADSGEDLIAFSSESDFAANIELAEAVAPESSGSQQSLEKVATPGQHSIEEVSSFLQIPAAETVKTLILRTDENCDQPLLALVLRGSDTLNEIKAAKIHGLSEPLVMADEKEVRTATGAAPGSVGPLDLKIPVYVDRAAAALAAFVCGANEDGFHFKGASWGRDCHSQYTVVDLRNVVEGDPSPDGKGQIQLKRGIEVGHIFKLGAQYASAMNATVLDANGKATVMEMGCYGIGVTRVVAAAIEQNHDENGIIWPDAIAPFSLALAPLNMHKSEAVREAAEALYRDLQAAGYAVLMDDRNERPGVKFADLELMGIPHRLVISDRGLKEGTLEYKGRRDAESRNVAQADVLDFLKEVLSGSH